MTPIFRSVVDGRGFPVNDGTFDAGSAFAVPKTVGRLIVMPPEAAKELATAARATVIRLTRTSEWKNYFRAIAVYIDRVRVGKIRNGQTITFPIDPGEHELFVKIDWCESNAIGLQVQEGVTVELSCGSGCATKRPLPPHFRESMVPM